MRHGMADNSHSFIWGPSSRQLICISQSLDDSDSATRKRSFSSKDATYYGPDEISVAVCSSLGYSK
jgi:hypothetical protein